MSDAGHRALVRHAGEWSSAAGAADARVRPTRGLVGRRDKRVRRAGSGARGTVSTAPHRWWAPRRWGSACRPLAPPPPPPRVSSAPSARAAVASIFTSKYLQARRPRVVACNFSDAASCGRARRRARPRWRAARLDDGWRGCGRAGRRAPIAAPCGGSRARPPSAIAVPRGGIALAREMASLFGVARAEQSSTRRS